MKFGIPCWDLAIKTVTRVLFFEKIIAWLSSRTHKNFLGEKRSFCRLWISVGLPRVQQSTLMDCACSDVTTIDVPKMDRTIHAGCDWWSELYAQRTGLHIVQHQCYIGVMHVFASFCASIVLACACFKNKNKNLEIVLVFPFFNHVSISNLFFNSRIHEIFWM